MTLPELQRGRYEPGARWVVRLVLLLVIGLLGLVDLALR